MVELKLVIGNKDGKSYQKVVENFENLVGKKIGEKIKGDLIGMGGYEFLISGGSDDSGFPMKKGIDSARKKILAVKSIGIRKKGRGIYSRKSIAGGVINEKITQLNLKVISEGKRKLEEIFGKKEVREKKEEKPEQKDSK